MHMMTMMMMTAHDKDCEIKIEIKICQLMILYTSSYYTGGCTK